MPTARDPSSELTYFSGPPVSTAVPIAIDEALRNHWLEIWYQPKIDLKRKCLAGAEALTCIRHPQEGLLWPDSFLSAIDDEGLVRLIEHALLANLRNWAMFEDAGFNLYLALNVPANALNKVPIAELVTQNRPRSPNWPGLILEITEDQIVRDVEHAKQCAATLKACRVAIAIDDFGAGYSSFSSLRDLPFAEIKLDGSFVTNCATDATNAAICQTAIDLAHRFGSSVVAQGIENATDLQALAAMSCDFGQGPLVSPPLPKERFLELLLRRNNKPQQQAAPAVLPPIVAGRVA